MKKIAVGKVKVIKALVLTLKLLTFALALYLIMAPFYPEIKYRFFMSDKNQSQELSQVVSQVEEIKNGLPSSDDDTTANRLIIPKIGVNIPIIVAQDEQYGLSRGAWLVPQGSTPDKGGNTVLTGHRFKYLPPSNLTFYLFNKLEKDDVFSVIWEKKSYFYKIKEIKIVDPSDPSPYNKSDSPVLTMYTCDPIYSTSHRLVVISELIKN